MAKVRPVHEICEGRTTISVTTALSNDFDFMDFFKGQQAICKRNIDQILKSRGIIRTVLASLLGVEKGRVTQWIEYSNRDIPIDYTFEIARFLNCSCSEMVLGEPRAIRAPKKVCVLYDMIKNRGLLTEAKQLLQNYEPEKKTPPKLVVQRLLERADDLNQNVRNMTEAYNPSLSFALARTVRKKEFAARLGTFAWLCFALDESADFLLAPNYSFCEIFVGDCRIEDRFRPVVGKFIALSPADQSDILGQLLAQSF